MRSERGVFEWMDTDGDEGEVQTREEMLCYVDPNELPDEMVACIGATDNDTGRGSTEIYLNAEQAQRVIEVLQHAIATHGDRQSA